MTKNYKKTKVTIINVYRIQTDLNQAKRDASLKERGQLPQVKKVGIVTVGSDAKSSPWTVISWDMNYRRSASSKRRWGVLT